MSPPEQHQHIDDIVASHVSVINVHRRRRKSTGVLSSSSSSSASVNRSSFASDYHDRDSSASESYQHLAGRGSGGGESLSGLDLDPDKCFTVRKPSGGFGYVREYTNRVQKQGSQSEIEEDTSTNSTPVSFSLALKDCQDWRSKGNVKGTRDFKHAISIGVKSGSPRLEALKKDIVLSRLSSTIASPGNPSYQFPSGSMQKGWNSERMALPVKGNRVGPALLPLKNVKTLPSKWEDAERWIFSPAYGDSSNPQPAHQHQYHRKPKAKSGPLGPPGSAYHSMYTPVIPMTDRRSVGELMGDSPFSAGLMATKGLSTSIKDLGKGSPARLEPWMPRSVSLRGCSVECPGQSSVPSSEDDNVGEMNDTVINLSCPVSRRDIATQMSPSDSTNSSFKRISLSHNEKQSQSSLSKVRDVEMDEKITIGSLKNIHRADQSGRSSRSVNNCTKKVISPISSAWGCKETAIGLGNGKASAPVEFSSRNFSKGNFSRSSTDEARIIEWENLQKAKADAAIQKLEMKLEKKKTSSMNKIMKKLKSAQKKAQEMRIRMVSNQPDQAAKSSSGKRSSMSKVRQRSSLSGCFTCHACDLP